MREELTQAEADSLIAMEKHRMNDDDWEYPGLGVSLSIPLVSLDKRENFILDVARGRIVYEKVLIRIAPVRQSFLFALTSAAHHTEIPTEPKYPHRICTFIDRDMPISGPSQCRHTDSRT